MCMDGRVPAGFFESEDPVDQQKGGIRALLKTLLFRTPDVSEKPGDLRIWSMGWEPAGVSAAGPDSDEGHMRPQMLLAETMR